MKKKRFYNYKKRGKKWTEQQTGRKIYFADKYIEAGSGFNKFDDNRSKTKKPFFTKDNMQKSAKYFIIILCCVFVVFAGYTAMDVHMQRNAMPIADENVNQSNGVADIAVEVKGSYVDSVSLDGGVILASVINETLKSGYTSVAFDLKRSDGTIGYQSQLATIDMYGAKSSCANDAEGSIKRFSENDIMPIGVISCYKDNVLPANDLSTALTVNGGIYTDDASNTYLNPDSESAYNYIKSIVEEVSGMGVSVFILKDCDLPDEIKSPYNDGFTALAQKLYNDLGNDIKLMNGVDITISSSSVKAIEKEWLEKTEDIDGDNIVFCVTAKSSENVTNVLNSKGNVNYIITQ